MNVLHPDPRSGLTARLTAPRPTARRPARRPPARPGWPPRSLPQASSAAYHSRRGRGTPGVLRTFGGWAGGPYHQRQNS